jgi:hypothetical protein
MSVQLITRHLRPELHFRPRCLDSRMNNLPRTVLRYGAIAAIAIGVVAAAHAAANRKAGDRPNSKSSEPHPGDARAAEKKSKAESEKSAAHDKATLDRYDINRNGKLDPDEVAAMQADKRKSAEKKTGRGKR